MLVLSRRVGERIFIGGNIVITITDIDRNKVRIGVTAPKDVGIYREELLPTDDPRLKTPVGKDEE